MNPFVGTRNNHVKHNYADSKINIMDFISHGNKQVSKSLQKRIMTKKEVEVI